MLAHTLAVVEFLVGWYFLPAKLNSVCLVVGLAMISVGHVLRIGAMFTAARNFNHEVQFKKAQGHQLVTHGVYSVCRHPSYFGWFLWSTGTQVILCSPICFAGFFVVSYKFFSSRIETEEEQLYAFFGQEYRKFCERSPILIPFIDRESAYPFKSY